MNDSISSQKSQSKKALQEATPTSPTKVVHITKKGNTRRKTKPRAPCWQHFSEYSIEDGENRAKCNYCDVTYTIETGASTTNLNNHLKTCSRKPRELSVLSTVFEEDEA
ncbi:hypothetical protein ES332_A09G108800v1 [Gossypium tomentosum]|uniref:BED-type domain-containing protein n=1 Tax=Gossypium tomentosum TaxID=34277 RepID=A0A5D2P2G5_GOSTO|nr:hypothetical protein ES332_A09G108800v1 [Gossypium tomentosum]